MKGHSRVFAGGWLPIFWTSDRLLDIRSSVQLLLWRPRERGLHDLQLNFFAFQRGRCLSKGGALTLPNLSTGGRDHEVGQACLHSHRLILIEEIVVLSGDWASGRQANGPSSTSMPASSPGDEPETGAAALPEGASLALELGGITASAPWSSRSSL